MTIRLCVPPHEAADIPVALDDRGTGALSDNSLSIAADETTDIIFSIYRTGALTSIDAAAVVSRPFGRVA